MTRTLLTDQNFTELLELAHKCIRLQALAAQSDADQDCRYEFLRVWDQIIKCVNDWTHGARYDSNTGSIEEFDFTLLSPKSRTILGSMNDLWQDINSVGMQMFDRGELLDPLIDANSELPPHFTNLDGTTFVPTIGFDRLERFVVHWHSKVCPVKLKNDGKTAVVLGKSIVLRSPAFKVIQALVANFPDRLKKSDLDRRSNVTDASKYLRKLAEESAWKEVLHLPGQQRDGYGFRNVELDD